MGDGQDLDQEVIIPIIVSILSSGVLSAVITKLMDYTHENTVRRVEEKKNAKEKQERYRDEYITEKKDVYIQALKMLAEIRIGLDHTVKGPNMPASVRQRIQEVNRNATDLSAKMRLYASDDVYDLYWHLSRWSVFAYSNHNSSGTLVERCKNYYSTYTTMLARLMQADLGYRDYVSNPEMIKCPKCHRQHDAYQTCRCGMTWNQTITQIQADLTKEMEQEVNTGDK